MTHPINCAIEAEIRRYGNPDYNPIMQADPCVCSNAPSLGSSRARSPPIRFCFLVFREGGSQREGCIDPTQVSRLVLTELGNTPSRHASTEKYTNENIYARCQSSVRYLACCMSVTDGQIGGKNHQDTNVPRSNAAISKISLRYVDDFDKVSTIYRQVNPWWWFLFW